MEVNLNNFNFPEYYTWPFFFTLQKHSETKIKQLGMWSELITEYSKYANIWRLSKSQFMNDLGKNVKVNRYIINNKFF